MLVFLGQVLWSGHRGSTQNTAIIQGILCNRRLSSCSLARTPLYTLLSDSQGCSGSFQSRAGTGVGICHYAECIKCVHVISDFLVGMSPSHIHGSFHVHSYTFLCLVRVCVCICVQTGVGELHFSLRNHHLSSQTDYQSGTAFKVKDC